VHLVHPGWEGREGLMSVQGVVKTYDPTTGVGVVVRDDDGSEVFLRPGSLEGSIFRFVRQGQRILFDVDDAGRYVSAVRVGQEGY
jgi:cold shock CspA family protein